MKITSHILSLILSDMKPEYIYVQLIFITLFLKVGWFMFVAFLSHTMKTFTCRHDLMLSHSTGRLSLCY
jgi:hypothetical protein